MPGTSKKISELDSASSLGNSDLLEVAVVNALSDTGYSSKKTTIEDLADKVVAINPQEQADWTEADSSDPSYIQNKPTLATVATSGDYEDLTNKPIIPSAQVNSDWDAVSGVAQILNKPTLGTAASKDTGVANGVAELDSNGLVPTSQLPSYVDDVLEYASQSAFPATGETGKIYVALDTNLTYRWSGSAYVEISPSLALGETSSTAYAGNKGKANADAIAALQTTVGSLATVATTGDYDDLIDKPTIPDGLADLTDDVNISSPTDGQVLKYDGTSSKWVNGTGGGGGASALNDLTDVTITSATDGQVLKYDSTSSKWINSTGSSAGVELTWAEYQQLSPAEQMNGTEYFITDVNGDGSQFQPVIYSETEREIGVWVDGKPLYEKTINVGTITTNTTVAHGIDNLDTIIDYSGFGKYAGTDKTVMPFQNPANGYGFGINTYDGTNLVVAKANSLGSNVLDCYMTLRYTKTTDQAGSGTWTPQGVPAHHYSTSEQVVGTWIDGNTLYEKTVTFTAPNSNAYTSQSLGATFDYVTIIETSAIKGSQVGKLCGAYNGNPVSDEWEGFINSTNSTLDYRVGSSYYGANCYVTIRYTKSST